MSDNDQNIFEYQLIPGFRRNSKLLYIPSEKEIFKYKYEKNLIKYYVCYNKKCPVNVAIDINNSDFCRKTKLDLYHNHESQEEIIEKLKLINKIKTNCETVSLKRSNIREIFDDTCKKFKANCTSVEFGKMRRHLYKIKSKVMPKTPSNFENIMEIFKKEYIIKEFALSRKEKTEKFYQNTIIEENFGYTIFMSPTISNIINSMPNDQPRYYLVDGTFSITPCCNVFKQVLIVHYTHAEHTFPFIYILMSSKSEAAYTHAFQFIKANLFDMKPSSIQTDFEKALRNGIKNVYPQAIMKPCWFHYMQSLRRNASKIPNFMRYLNKNTSAKRHFQKFLYLPLLKPEDLIAAYEMLKAKALSTTFAIHEDAKSFFEPFINYFERQWIKKEGSASISVYKQKIKTTSSIEGYNSRLSSKLAKNGNFFKFLDVILDEDFAASLDLEKSVDGCVSIYETWKKKRKDKDDFIRSILKNLEDGILSLQDVMNQLTAYNNLNLWKEQNQSNNDNNEEINDTADSDADNNERNINNIHIPNSNQNKLLCEICCINAKSVLLIPSNHYKIGSE